MTRSDINYLDYTWNSIELVGAPDRFPYGCTKVSEGCLVPFWFKQAYDGKKLIQLPELDGRQWRQRPL
jgi:protein gp37